MTDSAGLPMPPSTPVITFGPVVLDVPGRPVPLSVKVSVPATGSDLPVIVVSHGHGGSMFTASMYGYEPLTLFWAAHGFAVLQPNHLDANFLGLRESDDPDAPLFLRHRAADLRAVIDGLDTIAAAVPGLAERGLDAGRVANVGHSAGGNTVGLLAGSTVTFEAETTGEVDERVGARVLIAPPGRGADLGDWAGEHYPMLGGTGFEHMTPPALVVAGSEDFTDLFSTRHDWRSDAYADSPGPKTRLLLEGAQHMFGGISGFDAEETSDEDPERVAIVRTMIWGYLQTALGISADAWPRLQKALAAIRPGAVSVDTK